MTSLADRLGRFRPFQLRTAVALAILSAVVAVSTFLPGAPVLPDALTWMCFGLVFVVFPLALLPVVFSIPRTGFRDFAGRRAANRQIWAAVRDRVPRRVLVVVGVAFFAAWLSAMSGILNVKGQPEKHDGHYYADNHGSLIPLTRAEYDHQVAVGERGFVSVAAAFYAVSALLLLVGPIAREPRSTKP